MVMKIKFIFVDIFWFVDNFITVDNFFFSRHISRQLFYWSTNESTVFFCRQISRQSNFCRQICRQFFFNRQICRQFLFCRQICRQFFFCRQICRPVFLRILSTNFVDKLSTKNTNSKCLTNHLYLILAK